METIFLFFGLVVGFAVGHGWHLGSEAKRQAKAWKEIRDKFKEAGKEYDNAKALLDRAEELYNDAQRRYGT